MIIHRKNISQLYYNQICHRNFPHITNRALSFGTISKHNIDIVCLSEANITQTYLTNNNIIPNFTIETKPMTDTIDISRNAMLNNDRIPYTRRMDLEDPLIATIWILYTH